MPATPFFREGLDIGRRGHLPEPATKPDPALKRITQCDAQGNFKFQGVPAGKYIVASEVRWVVAGIQQGGVVGKDIDVPATGNVTVFLTDEDRM